MTHDDASLPASPAWLSAEQVLEGVSDAFVALDRDWRYVYVNAHAGELFGREPASLVGRHIWTEFPDGVGQPFHLAYERAMAEQRPIILEDYMEPWDRWFENRIHPTPDGLVIFFHEITDRKRAERRLQEEMAAHRDSLALLDTFIDASPVGMAFIDRDLHYRRVNPALARLSGVPAPKHVGHRVGDLIPDVDPVAVRILRRVLERGEPVLDVEIVGRSPGLGEDDQHWLSSFYPVRADGGPVLGAGVIVRDVTEQRRTQTLLVERATRDPLTGLPNRALFIDRLEHAAARRRSRHLAVLFVDLDRFKVVNDSLGHAAGDELLKAVAGRITGALRTEDTVARLGGDEFAILCEDVDDEPEAVRLAERVLQSLAEPFGGSPPLHIDASVGVALAGSEATDAAPLLRDADTAMYQAKADGRRRVRVFDSRLRERAVARHSLEQRLRRALRADALQVHYQPVVDLRTGRVTGVEALSRWTDGEAGEVPPSTFVPVAEDSGLIHTLGSAVLAKACAQAAHWTRELPLGTAPVVAVNLSPLQLLRGEVLVAEVRDLLADHRLAASALCLEITESSVIAETEVCTKAVRALAALGIELAVDDFGTGYSSLAYLTRLPVGAVKADRSFVSGIATDDGSSQVVRAVLGLAQGLGLRTVAEGTERQAQVDALTLMGCDSAQGFLYSPAVPARELEPMLEQAFR